MYDALRSSTEQEDSTSRTVYADSEVLDDGADDDPAIGAYQLGHSEFPFVMTKFCIVLEGSMIRVVSDCCMLHDDCWCLPTNN